ncbi:unnamed protein product [Moneuplotes crassus]|uniref:Uncharacterized protein n=1 Tax=Euplotes crassus TaxID=5936 RepID=A0AAD2D316_EUPCR|nr:unnamed protein product [Moneuplotes crassus]
MESASQILEDQKGQVQEEEGRSLEIEKEKRLMLAAAHYFKSFSKELEVKEYESGYRIDSKDIDLNLFEHDQNVFSYIKKLSFIEEFNTNRLYLSNVKCSNKYFIKFLKLSFPQEVDLLAIYSERECIINVSLYLNAITRISPRVLKEIDFYGFRINSLQLKRLMNAFKHVYELGYRCCQISIPAVPNFLEALRGTNIDILILSGSEIYENGDKEDSPQTFTNLIEGLATSPDFRQSLKQVEAYHCEVEQVKVLQLLLENGFNESVKLFM